MRLPDTEPMGAKVAASVIPVEPLHLILAEGRRVDHILRGTFASLKFRKEKHQRGATRCHRGVTVDPREIVVRR